MFDRFKKKKEEHEESSGSGMMEELPVEEFHSEKIAEAKHIHEEVPPQETRTQPEMPSHSGSQIGIRGLKDKRVKLEEAIDYVGLMIKNLKDKRTSLEKEIEEEDTTCRSRFMRRGPGYTLAATHLGARDRQLTHLRSGPGGPARRRGPGAGRRSVARRHADAGAV